MLLPAPGQLHSPCRKVCHEEMHTEPPGKNKEALGSSGTGCVSSPSPVVSTKGQGCLDFLQQAFPWHENEGPWGKAEKSWWIFLSKIESYQTGSKARKTLQVVATYLLFGLLCWEFCGTRSPKVVVSILQWTWIKQICRVKKIQVNCPSHACLLLDSAGKSLITASIYTVVDENTFYFSTSLAKLLLDKVGLQKLNLWWISQR